MHTCIHMRKRVHIFARAGTSAELVLWLHELYRVQHDLQFVLLPWFARFAHWIKASAK